MKRNLCGDETLSEKGHVNVAEFESKDVYKSGLNAFI